MRTTTRARAWIAGVAIAATMATGCAGDAEPTASVGPSTTGTTEPATVTTAEQPTTTTAPATTAPPATTTAPPPTTTTPPPPTTAAAAAGDVTVPDVVGLELQLAQDTLQSAGLFVLTSHDATGAGRMQILDRNWKVCTQTPAAGSVIREDLQVDLGAVKTDEACP